MKGNIAFAIQTINSQSSISNSYHVDMDIFEIRRNNVLTIIKTKFNDKQADFARAIKKTPGYIWQQVSGYRRIGEKAARDIEAKLRLPENYLDTLTSGAEIKTERPVHPPVAVELANRIHLLPPALLPPVIATLEAMEKIAAAQEPATRSEQEIIEAMAQSLLKEALAYRESKKETEYKTGHKKSG